MYGSGWSCLNGQLLVRVRLVVLTCITYSTCRVKPTYKHFYVFSFYECMACYSYCTVLFFDNQGCYLGKHRKLMPTALERVIWGFGDGSHIPVFDTPIGKIGAAICWENKMPLLRTAMYAKGPLHVLN